VSFNDRMLTDADFRDRVEADAVARMNPERARDGDWADRVDEPPRPRRRDRGGRPPRGEAAARGGDAHRFPCDARWPCSRTSVAVAVSGMTRAVGERDHVRRFYCHSEAATMSGMTAQTFARFRRGGTASRRRGSDD
jgi:hypothetical protein